jgi:hypothetical protein
MEKSNLSFKLGREPVQWGHLPRERVGDFFCIAVCGPFASSSLLCILCTHPTLSPDLQPPDRVAVKAPSMTNA